MATTAHGSGPPPQAVVFDAAGSSPTGRLHGANVDFHQHPLRLRWLRKLNVAARYVEVRHQGRLVATLLAEFREGEWVAWKAPAGPEPSRPYLDAVLSGLDDVSPVRIYMQPIWTEESVLDAHGFEPAPPFSTLLVPAVGSDEAILSRMRPSVRSRVRRAQREGLRVVEAAGLAQQFYAVLDANLEAVDSPDRPTLHEVSSLAELPTVRLLVALHGERIAAGSMCFEDDRSLEARYVTTASEFRSVGALNLVHFEALRLAREHGKDHLDLSGWSDDRSNSKTEAINRFKAGFGGVVHQYPCFLRTC